MLRARIPVTIATLVGLVLAPTAHSGAPVAGGAPQAASTPTVAPGLPIPPLPIPPSPDVVKPVVEEASPLSPEQIRALRRLIDAAERAAADPPRFVPKPVSTTLTASLAPGATPPVVRLAANFVTSVLFLDTAGNPLNILDVTSGGASAFSITWVQGQRPTNKVDVSPKSTYASGNISVLLEGVMTPVSLTLVSGQREVDYRVDVRVKGRFLAGPGAAVVAGADGASPVLLTLLDGVAPDGARPLTSSHGDVQVWVIKNRYFVRSQMPLLSPAFITSMKAADGTAVYEIPPTPVLVLMSAGRAMQIQVTGF